MLTKRTKAETWRNSAQAVGINRAYGSSHSVASIFWPSKEFALLWTIFAILLILWLLGFGYRVGGWSVHLLLVAAMLVLIVHIWRPDILHRR
jgi:hypothetical protein